MSLPKIDMPMFNVVIPSSKKKTTFRPFTVKEEKILLIAQESKDLDQIVLAIKQIINNCVNKVDVDTMPVFDLEYLMLNIRSKSVNNEINFTIKDNETDEDVNLILDLDKVTVMQKEGHNNKIVLNDDYFISMRYPTINELKIMLSEKNNSEKFLEVVTECIEFLSSNDGEQIYRMCDFSIEEKTNFINDLSSNAIQRIQTFFETSPMVKIELPYILNNGKKKTFVMEGLESFFI